MTAVAEGAQHIEVGRAELTTLTLGAMMVVGEVTETYAADAHVTTDLNKDGVYPGASIGLHTVSYEGSRPHSISFFGASRDEQSRYSIRDEQYMSDSPRVNVAWLEQTGSGPHKVSAHRDRDTKEPLHGHESYAVPSDAVLGFFRQGRDARPIGHGSAPLTLMGRSTGHDAIGVHHENITPALSKLLQITSATLARHDAAMGDMQAHLRVDFGSTGRLYRDQEIAFELSNRETQRLAVFSFMAHTLDFVQMGLVRCNLRTEDWSDENHVVVTEDALVQDDRDLLLAHKVYSRPEDGKPSRVSTQKVDGEAAFGLADSAAAFVGS
jgi:hypothetical protein